METPTLRESLTDAIHYWEPLRLAYNAVLANVAYCAAYFADIFAQWSGYRETWRKNRWILFAIGLLFAGVLTRFWAMAMFSFTSK
jgi:hypothetical protein